jgi:Carboxypeptidase regulatory-like domain
MSRTIACSLLASLLWIAVPAAQDGVRVPAGVPGTVTLTRADYDRLLDLASARPRGVDPAPLAAALTRADIRATIAGASVRATMRVDGEAFRPGVSKVTLIKSATLLDARMDARPLPVITEGGAHVALVTGPSTFSATLEVGAPISYAPGRASFVLPVPNSGSATATIDVPGEQADVHVRGGLIQRRASANGRTTIEATLTPGTQTEVWWSTHDTPSNASARDVRLLADVKSVVTIADADVRLVSLVNATIVQGEPSQIDIALPAGYELASVSGATVDHSEAQPNRVVVYLADPSVRRHQFLISLERSQAPGSFKLETGLPALPAAQRETGEVAVEGLGTMEVSSPEMPGLRRMDVRELDPAVASVARDSLLAAYRYQRTGDEPPALTIDVRRFADAAVLAAVAERAVATTLVTAEGRALTEVTLWIRNRAQSYMKVALPAGASIVSVEVGGLPAAPVEGTDGSRVPLLRPGLRTDGLYAVSFAYLHAGTPFLKKGDMQLKLPPMDMPVNVVEWELFVPDRIRADRFDGNVIGAGLVGLAAVGVPAAYINVEGVSGAAAGGGQIRRELNSLDSAMPGQIAGRVLDSTGAPLPGVTVTVESGGRKQQLFTATDGSYVASNVAPGDVTITGELQGFKNAKKSVQQTGGQVDLTLEVGSVSESVTVNAQMPAINTMNSTTFNNAGQNTDARRAKVAENTAPSVNVQNLQRRAAGVLPIRIDVPRAGSSHRFVRPLVIDEETVVTFRYKRR